MSENEQYSFESINTRLKEIQAAVEDDDMPLDDALSLFEEAVQLGMQASSLLEEGIAQGSVLGADEASAPNDGEAVLGDGERTL